MRLDDLLAEILGTAVALPAENVEWRKASVGVLLGRHLAAPISAAFDLPRVDVSAMDGWAVRSGDLAAATAENPIVLKVIGDAAAGRSGAELVVAPGDCVRIATGAPIPRGADAVVV
ncbi:MAG: gephyrin-like molybdotransferase Glp, partial [Candidatus Limnocylindrus sp.]